MKRIFIGVNFSSELKDYFHEAGLMIEKYCETAKYTSNENFHFTLKFLGMMDEASIDSLINIIKNLEVTQLNLCFDHIGFFKKKNRYIIYMGYIPTRR